MKKTVRSFLECLINEYHFPAWNPHKLNVEKDGVRKYKCKNAFCGISYDVCQEFAALEKILRVERRTNDHFTII